MGKNRRNQIHTDNIFGSFNVDSNEEIMFFSWCEELYQLGYIDIDKEKFYQPNTYTLLPKTTIECSLNDKSVVLREHVYSTDFIIKPKKELYDLFPKLAKYLIVSNDGYCHIDIKGNFAKNDGGRSFSINQKLLYLRFGIYVNKVIPDKLFEKSFIPKKEQYSPKKKKLREKYKGLKTLDEILKKEEAVK